MAGISTGQTVSWNWGSGTGTGKVLERFDKDVTRTLKGSEITRKATPSCPAFLIEQEDGDRVLKSASELSVD